MDNLHITDNQTDVDVEIKTFYYIGYSCGSIVSGSPATTDKNKLISHYKKAMKKNKHPVYIWSYVCTREMIKEIE